jgi:hypothetical protein
MLCIAALTVVFETQARREPAPVVHEYVFALKPGANVQLLATVDQVSVLSSAQYSRCICQGYCIWKNMGSYSQWVRECVSGTTPFDVPGVGPPPPGTCTYCPPAPC